MWRRGPGHCVGKGGDEAQLGLQASPPSDAEDSQAPSGLP